MPKPTPDICPGQIWADNDPRCSGRHLRVVEVDETHAVVELTVARLPVSSAKPGRRTRIRLDRFRPTSTGYRLVEDAPTASEADRV